jgi:hypothetical protein
MATYRVREEVLNVVLAGLLEDRGLLSIPETIRRSISGREKRLPDVTLGDLWGVRIIIEGRINTDAGTPASLLEDARKRVEEGLCPICLAVLYPPEVADIESIPRLKKSIEKATLKALVCSEGDADEDDKTWMETSVDGLTEILRRSYELLVSEDVVITTATDLEESIESASQVFASSSATPKRIRKLLGIPEETNPASKNKEDED